MRKILLFFMLFIAGSAALLPVSALADIERRPNFMDNDELEQALAELGDDAPTVYEEKSSVPASSASPVSEDSAVPSEDVQAAVAKILKPSDTKTVEGPASDIKQQVETLKIESEKLVYGPTSRYVMMRQLSQADVQITAIESEEKAAGVWEDNGFSFPGFENTDMKVENFTFPSGKRPVINVKLSPKHIYRLRFNGVPPFSRIKIQYRLQEPPDSKVLNYMYFKVYIGQHELKRIQVSSKDSWIVTALDTGVVSFLNKELPVSFEFATNQASGLIFSFIPETE